MTNDPKTGHASSTDKQDALDALNALKAGNERYLAVPQSLLHPNTSADVRTKLAGGQKPKVCILACADSRVPPEIIFDQGLGDMFVVRVAGNVANTDNQASIEYAVQHFAPAIIVVLGHEKCGAVEAAAITFDPKSVNPENVAKFQEHHAHSPVSENLKALARQLSPAVADTGWTKYDADRNLGSQNPQPATKEEYALRLSRAVQINVTNNCDILSRNEVIKKSSAFVIGACYDLDEGRVRFVTRGVRHDQTGDIDWLFEGPKWIEDKIRGWYAKE